MFKRIFGLFKIEADALRPNSAYARNISSEKYFSLIRDHILKLSGFAVNWNPTRRVYNTFVKGFPYVP